MRCGWPRNAHAALRCVGVVAHERLGAQHRIPLRTVSIVGADCTERLDVAVVVNAHNGAGHRARPAILAHIVRKPTRIVARNPHVGLPRILARSAKQILRAIGTQRWEKAAAATVGAIPRRLPIRSDGSALVVGAMVKRCHGKRRWWRWRCWRRCRRRWRRRKRLALNGEPPCPKLELIGAMAGAQRRFGVRLVGTGKELGCALLHGQREGTACGHLSIVSGRLPKSDSVHNCGGQVVGDPGPHWLRFVQWRRWRRERVGAAETEIVQQVVGAAAVHEGGVGAFGQVGVLRRHEVGRAQRTSNKARHAQIFVLIPGANCVDHDFHMR